MNGDFSLALNAFSLLLGSSLLVAVLNNSRKASVKHKILVAEASKSVTKRIEMYYRIRRRTDDYDDIRTIRDLFHKTQEENAYYKNLLITESKWHGERYVLYISAIQKLTANSTRDAWEERPFGPDVTIELGEQPDMKRVNELGLQFAKDSRRLMNPLMRIIMRIRDSWLIKKIWKITVYES